MLTLRKESTSKPSDPKLIQVIHGMSVSVYNNINKKSNIIHKQQYLMNKLNIFVSCFVLAAIK